MAYSKRVLLTSSSVLLATSKLRYLWIVIFIDLIYDENLSTMVSYFGCRLREREIRLVVRKCYKYEYILISISFKHSSLG